AMSVRRCLGGLNGDSVLTQNFDCCVGDRFAGLDRNQKNIARAAGTFLGHNSNVCDKQEPTVLNVADRSLLVGVPAARDQKEKTPLGSAIGGFTQLLGKIERRIVGFPFVLERDWLVLNCDARDVFLVEQMGI